MPKIGEEKDGEAGTPFILKNASSGFEGRSGDIFSQLDVLEKQHISHEQSRTDLDDFADLKGDGEDDDDAVDRTSSWKKKFKPRKDDTEQQGKGDSFGVPPEDAEPDELGHSSHQRERKQERQSGGKQPPKPDPQFRRPSGRAPGRFRGRPGRVPDDGKTPHNWTHYSLEDVKGSDMSDESNTQAALAFLEERRQVQAKKEEEDMEEEEAFDVGSAACSKGMLSFAKRSKAKSSSSDDPDKSASPGTDNVTKSDKLPAPAAQLAATDKETDTEQALDEENVQSSLSSAKDDAAQTSFKSRKGIKRNIRTRDEDD